MQCITLVSSRNIASAVASLDPAADMAVGIKLLAGSDRQARAQIDLAKECFGFAFEKAGDTSSNDIVSLAMELPKVVKDPAVCDISGALLVVAQADQHDKSKVPISDRCAWQGRRREAQEEVVLPTTS